MAIKRDQADIWFSKAVRLRDGHCLRCGTDQTLQCMHIWGRRIKSVRWSMDNAVTGCAGCHRYFTEQPLAFADWLRGIYGDGHLDMLREKSQAILKTTKQLRAEIAKHYRQEVAKKEANPDYSIISYN